MSGRDELLERALSGGPVTDAELDEHRAFEAWDALSPEEKARHKREQYISFIYGNLRLSGSAATREQVAAAYDELLANGEIRVR